MEHFTGAAVTDTTHQSARRLCSSLAPSQHSLLFRELAGESSEPASPADPAAPASISISPEISYSAQPGVQPGVQQSHKSLFGAGVKATASPQLKGSFSTQTGQSYANFRQYG